MLIGNSCQYSYCLNKQQNTRELSFRRILPRHLFIQRSGYSKSRLWANAMIKTIDKNAAKLRTNDFLEVLEGIKKDYHDFFVNNRRNKELFEVGNDSLSICKGYGEDRTLIWSFSSAKETRYESYTKNADLLFCKDNKNIHPFTPTRNFANIFMYYMHRYHQSSIEIDGKIIPLSRIYEVNLPPSHNLYSDFGKHFFLLGKSSG